MRPSNLFRLILIVLIPVFLLGFYHKKLDVSQQETEGSLKNTNLKILSYNIWNGFEGEESRKKKFTEWVKQEQPDILALQELVNISEVELKKMAKAWGHPYVSTSKEAGYPVGLTSRYPLKNVRKVLQNMHHGYLVAEVEGLLVYVVHLSPFSHQKRVEEAQVLLKDMEKYKRKELHVLVMGDFNTYAASDSLFYLKSDLQKALKEQGEKHSHVNNLTERRAVPFEPIHTFLQKGLHDIYSEKKSQQAFQHSFPTKVFGEVPLSEKVRIDFILTDKKLAKKCTQVAIIKDSVTHQLSDHYPVQMIFRK
ncbi:endonuclease/exonuclease/phosphatase family protein [Rapidithrix thailandica]|uniref:Endonuclease/exonuclease/phosphatase family protein n=1 Tax=Rapidithrix thailandica TaxID=413964 RepID=A0AAW9SFU9_9BACT